MIMLDIALFLFVIHCWFSCCGAHVAAKRPHGGTDNLTTCVLLFEFTWLHTYMYPCCWGHTSFAPFSLCNVDCRPWPNLTLTATTRASDAKAVFSLSLLKVAQAANQAPWLERSDALTVSCFPPKTTMMQVWAVVTARCHWTRSRRTMESKVVMFGFLCLLILKIAAALIHHCPSLATFMAADSDNVAFLNWISWRG